LYDSFELKNLEWKQFVLHKICRVLISKKFKHLTVFFQKKLVLV
jgi:hypothetical protein